MAKRNYLIEGGSGTGKSAVWEELQKRGYKAINGDRELAYRGDAETGKPIKGLRSNLDSEYLIWIWDVDKVRKMAADKEDDVAFFCGGSRNFHKFMDVFDKVFVLDVDIETLKKRLQTREADDMGGNDEEKEFILHIHSTKKAILPKGIEINTNRPLTEVVDIILEHTKV